MQNLLVQTPPMWGFSSFYVFTNCLFLDFRLLISQNKILEVVALGFGLLALGNGDFFTDQTTNRSIENIIGRFKQALTCSICTLNQQLPTCGFEINLNGNQIKAQTKPPVYFSNFYNVNNPNKTIGDNWTLTKCQSLQIHWINLFSKICSCHFSWT